MKNIGTKAEVLEYEKDKVASFMKELQAITKKYKIKGVFAGTRKQTPKFTDEDASVCAASVGGFGLDDLSSFEAKSLIESIDQSKEETFCKIKDIAMSNEE